MERRNFIFSLLSIGSIGTLIASEPVAKCSTFDFFSLNQEIETPKPPHIYLIQTYHSHRHEDGVLSSCWFVTLKKPEDLQKYLKAKNLQLSDIAILDKIN